jgi:hypothetical protein
MGYSYTIVQITRFTANGLPDNKNDLPIPEQHRPYLSSQGRWTRILADLLFGFDEREHLEGVAYLLNRIPTYEEIQGDLIDEDLDTFWTEEKHTGLLAAFHYFAERELDFMESV